MTSIDLFHFGHVIAFALIFAIDLPAYYAAKLVGGENTAPELRLVGARVVRWSSVVSSGAMILLMGWGVEIAVNLGVYRVTQDIAMTITWAIILAWLALWVAAELAGTSALGKRLYTIEIWVRIIIGLGNVYDAITGFMGTGLIETKWLAAKVLLLGLVLIASGVARARLRPVRDAIGTVDPMSAINNKWDRDTGNAVAAALKRARPMVHMSLLFVLIAAWMGVTKSW
jgi:hypothetical protein